MSSTEMRVSAINESIEFLKISLRFKSRIIVLAL